MTIYIAYFFSDFDKDYIFFELTINCIIFAVSKNIYPLYSDNLLNLYENKRFFDKNLYKFQRLKICNIVKNLKKKSNYQRFHIFKWLWHKLQWY